METATPAIPGPVRRTLGNLWQYLHEAQDLADSDGKAQAIIQTWGMEGAEISILPAGEARGQHILEVVQPYERRPV